ncbi:MAG: hypothetical protein R3B70_18735 [Polyangiaceae bacterium]
MSEVERRFRAELPKILRASVADLDVSLAALDGYLAEASSPGFRKSLLAWQGRLYLEHGRHDEAVRVLRDADGLHFSDDLKNFNIKSDLAVALEKSGCVRDASAVLAAGLHEIKEPELLLRMLHALARISSSLSEGLPVGADVALAHAKRFYGIDDAPVAEAPIAEAVRVAELVHDASVRLDQLHFVVEEAKSASDKASLIEHYVVSIAVPHFKQLARELLRRAEKTAGSCS